MVEATQKPSNTSVISLHIDPSNDVADLTGREADIAIRSMPHGKSPTGELVGRKAAVSHAAVYGRDHQWVGWFGGERDRAWTEAFPFPDLPIAGALPDVHLQHAACVEGLGLAILPCFMAGPELERRTEPKPRTDIWVLVHPDLRLAPRLRLFRDAMVAALARLKPRLEGREAAP